MRLLGYLLQTTLILGQLAVAQMSPEYSSYATFTVDASQPQGPATVYGTVVVDGTTTCQACSQYYHYGQAYLALGGVGGYVTGSHVSPTSYISVSNAKTATVALNTNLSVVAQGRVWCSGIATYLYNTLLPFNTARIAESDYISLGYYPVSGLCNWGPVCQGSCTGDYGFSTNPNPSGTCYTPPQRYRQCLDLVINESCFLSRAICFGQPSQGICS